MATVKKGKLVAAGVSKSKKKAPMVDPKGAYTKVQQRTLGNMKHGGKKKAFLGSLLGGGGSGGGGGLLGGLLGGGGSKGKMKKGGKFSKKK